MRKYLVLLAALVLRVAAAPIVPSAERFGIYDANTHIGIPGGIPDRASGNHINVASYGFSTSATRAENDAAYNAALAASVEGDVIVFPAGTFQFSGLYLTTYANSNRTFRGQGLKNTKFILAAGQRAITIGVDPDVGNAFNRQGTVSAVSRGSTSLTVSGSLWGGNNQMYSIKFRNEHVTPIVLTNTRETHLRGLAVIGTGQSGGTFTIEHPMPHSYAAALAEGTATIAELHQLPWMTYGIGIEGMTFDCSAHTLGNPTFAMVMQYATQCWFKDVQINTAGNYAGYVLFATNCEFRHSRFLGVSGGTSRGGLMIEQCTNVLIEDNYIKGGPSLYHWGNNVNNVIAFNYFDGAPNINHRPHSSHNLYEGNVWPVAQSDGYYGGSTEDTIYRNYGLGNGLLSLKRFTRNYNVIGNVVGSPTASGTDYTEKWGYPNIGNEEWSGATVQPSLGIWWRDWDTLNHRPKRWPMKLTVKDDAYRGTLTILDSSQADDFEAGLVHSITSYPRTRNVMGMQFLYFGPRSGNTWPVDAEGPNATRAPLPALDAEEDAITGVSGFQEQDLDVLATAFMKANWYKVHNGIRPGEELAPGETLPDSYFRTSKPSFFGTLAWPPFDPFAPASRDITRIPAGWREVNGNEDYLGDPGTPSIHYAPKKARILRR